MGYRQIVYEQYASRFQDSAGKFNPAIARDYGRAYEYYLRGWLPTDKSARILEVGCGSGNLLYHLRRGGYGNISGVDVSPEQVELARQAGLDVTRANVLEYLQTAQEAYALILGIDIIEHLHKDEVILFLTRCHTALRNGGRIVLQTPNGESPWCTQHRYNDFTHEVCFNPNALDRLLRLTGFSEVEAREAGPVPIGYSALSTLRFILWRAIRLGLLAWNLVETGLPGSGVLTRVFLISAVKR